MSFEFATAGKILFGEGERHQAGKLAAGFGKKAFLISDGNVDQSADIQTSLAQNGMTYALFSVTGEPTIETAQKGVEQCRAEGCDLVISVGGGSVIDSGKAISTLVTNPGEPLDYLEVIGKGMPLEFDPLPMIAIPTTAGTGAEVTKNAVLKSEEAQVKVSLRHPLMLPKVAIIDPELTYSVPPSVTAQTGLDAFTQVIEPLLSVNANPLTDGICREGIPRAARSLEKAVRSGNDVNARHDMALVSLMGGLALANAKLGAVHGFAGPIGGMYPIPHGAVCGILLPYVMRMNLKALLAREPANPVLARFDEFAVLVTGNREATAEEGIRWLEELCERLALPGLAEYGVAEADIPEIVAKSRVSSSMKGNPIKLTDEELTEILTVAL